MHRQHDGEGAPAGLRYKKGDYERKGESGRCVGVSSGGKTTKIHALVDSLRRPASFMLTGGQAHDSVVAEELLDTAEIAGAAVLGDKAYGSKDIRTYIERRGARHVMPPKSNAREPREYDHGLYRMRSAVECCFDRLKQFRRVATRCDRLAVSFLAFVYVAAIVALLGLMVVA